MKNKIVVMCPYYGKLPPNILVTLYSMSKNDFIDWFIFTDDKTPLPEFNNIKIINSKFNDIKMLIKNKLGTKIKSVYKLCDYKPLYGIIFSDYIKNYQYWGYCDLDVVFGDLKKFLTDSFLKKYDKIFDLGHLSIYRNEKSINFVMLELDKLFNINLKKILNSEKIYVTDESYNGHISINEILEEKGFSIYKNRLVFSDTIVKYRNMHSSGRMKKKNEYYLYKNSKLNICHLDSNDREEIVYLHFQKRNFDVYIDTIIEDSGICITPKGFFYEKELNKSCFYKGIDFDLKKHIKAIIKMRKNKYREK